MTHMHSDHRSPAAHAGEDAPMEMDAIIQSIRDIIAAGENAATPPAPAPPPPPPIPTPPPPRRSASPRIDGGEARQVTQLLLDPARVRVWPGNARIHAHLTVDNCRDLIDSIVAEGGQKVPAVVRRITDDADHDYEVIAGTRRHWAIGWLRSHDRPDLPFVAEVAELDDEAAFRLADIENRVRADVCDLERARNYADALRTHYGNRQSPMAARLGLSKGWLSKMLKVATIPDAVVAAFAAPADVRVATAYALVQGLADAAREPAIMTAASLIAAEQAARRERGEPPCPAGTVLRRLLAPPHGATPPSTGTPGATAPLLVWVTPCGETCLTVESADRDGFTIRLHTWNGIGIDHVVAGFRNLLVAMEYREQELRSQKVS